MLKGFLHYIDLRSELEDFDYIHSEIEKGIVFKGTNLWILVFAIVVASVGLNTNSTAVIIGAMLISPLMGPINGMGYSLATYNFELFRRSVRNYSFSVFASLAASTLYFLISPVSTAYSELLARTNPTIYDVLIALFGGLAGIVAISTKQKGNVIPGVAIATALMPPLCTAGYGLATAQFNFFFGAFYLFTINTVFIAISSVVISQILEFPIRSVIDSNRKKRINRYIWSIIAITVLPSIFFGYRLVQNERFSENVSKFTNSVTIFEGAYLIKNEVDIPNRRVKLVYGGNLLKTQDKDSIRAVAKRYNLNEEKVSIQQGFALDEKSNNENEILKSKLSVQSATIKQFEQEKDSILNRPLMGRQILAEIKPIYKQVRACTYSETFIFTDSTNKYRKTSLVTFSVDKDGLRNTDYENINNWLKARLETTNVKTYFEEVEIPTRVP